MSPIKSIFNSLLRPSDLPPEAKQILEKEGELFSVQRSRVTVAYHKFRAPGKRFSGKRETAWGSLAVTRDRILGYVFRKRVIHLPFHREEVKAVKFSAINGKVFIIDADSGMFDTRRSGRIELRYHTDRADEVYGIVRGLLS